MLSMLLSGNMTIIVIWVSMVVNCKRVSTTGFHRVSTKPTSNLVTDALIEKANLEYVKKYRKEHPKSELSAKEIIRTRRK